MHVNPYLNFAGNAEEAFEHYRSVFGGELSSVVRFGDFPTEGATVPADEAGKMMHIALPIGGGNVLMASDVLASHGQNLSRGNTVYVSVHADSRDDAARIFEGLADGGEVEMPIADQPWGDYWGSLEDRFGVMWMVSHTPPS
jgi:PhnB protein